MSDWLVSGEYCGRCRELLQEITTDYGHGQGMRRSTTRTIPFQNIEVLISSADDCHLCNLIISELDPVVIQYQLDNFPPHPEDALDQIAAILPASRRVKGAHYTILATLQESLPREGIWNEMPLCDFAATDLENLEVPR